MPATRLILKIAFVLKCLYACMCVSTPRLILTSGMMWCDEDPMWLVKQALATACIISGYGISNDVQFRSQSNKS